MLRFANSFAQNIISTMFKDENYTTPHIILLVSQIHEAANINTKVEANDEEIDYIFQPRFKAKRKENVLNTYKV